MRGTEKQIAWAEELKSKAIKTFESAKEAEQSDAGVKVFDGMIEAIETAEYAGDIIEIFKIVNFTGNWQQDILSIASAYRVTKPNTEGQKKILNK